MDQRSGRCVLFTQSQSTGKSLSQNYALCFDYELTLVSIDFLKSTVQPLRKEFMSYVYA
jgi:hypothetical protein